MNNQQSQLIPLNIFQSYKYNYEDLPPKMLEQVKLWKSLNPEYKHTYFNDEEMKAYVYKNSSHFDGLPEAFDKAITGAARADLFRALILWNEGGIWADIDTAPKKPLREIIRKDDQAVSSIAHNPSQDLMIYISKHPILEALLKHACYAYNVEDKRGAQETAGPQSLGIVTSKLINLPDGRQITPEGIYWDKDRKFSIRGVKSNICPIDGLYTSKYAGYIKEIGGHTNHWCHIEREKLKNKNI